MTSADRSGGERLRVCFTIVALLACAVDASRGQQAITVTTTGGVLRVHAASFEIIEGEVLTQLRDGRSVRLDFALEVLARAAGTAIAQSRQSFNLSFDLWEERFAVTQVVTPPRSVSHLTRKAAETWCLDRLTVPLGELARLGRSTPFWVRLAYRVAEPTPAGSDDAPFTIQSLIDVLGRKRRETQSGKSIEAGPFQLSN